MRLKKTKQKAEEIIPKLEEEIYDFFDTIHEDEDLIIKEEPFEEGYSNFDTPKHEVLSNNSNSNVGIVKAEEINDDIKMLDDTVDESSVSIVKYEDLKSEGINARQSQIGSASAHRYELNGREYFYKCRSCTELRTNLISLIDHHRTVHYYTNLSRTYKHVELEPDIHDPDFYCRVCETKYPTDALFQKHLKMIHYIIGESNRLWKDLTVNRERIKTVLPDYNDPNYFCRLCKKPYHFKKRYYYHLAYYHKMKKVRKVQKVKITNPDLIPDLSDPNFYCNYCKRSFSSKYRFHCHCKVIHHMEIPAKGNPDLEDPDFYCKVCDIFVIDKPTFLKHCRLLHRLKTVDPAKPYCNVCKKAYKSLWYYKRHVRLVHEMMEDPLNQQAPDVNDPNYYCRACDKKLSSKDSFSRHIMAVHSVHFPDMIPVISHCKTCSMEFPSKASYRDHLLSEHKVPLNTEKGDHDPNFLPDPDDPDFFCRTCGKTKKTLGKYRKHCKDIHHMKLGKARRKKTIKKKRTIEESEFCCSLCKRDFQTERRLLYHSRSFHKLNCTLDGQRLPDPDATIDFKSPNFDCVKCGRTYEDSASFKLHLKVVHDLTNEKGEADLYCSICNKQYQNNASFKKHLTNVHKLDQPQLDHVDDDTEQVNNNPESIIGSPKSDIDHLDAVLGDIDKVIDNLEAVDSKF